jgi:hypothetical protein
MATEQDIETGEKQLRYFIDLEWYQRQERSLATLATSRLCPTSRKKEKTKSEAVLLHVCGQGKWDNWASQRDGHLREQSYTCIEQLSKLFNVAHSKLLCNAGHSGRK